MGDGGTLTVTLLGTPILALDGAPVRGFVSSKAAALLYYLAATRQVATRAALASLLWSETSDQQALKNLRDVLSNLRRLVGPWLLINRATVAWNDDGGAIIDSQRFEQLAHGDDTVALGLYSGDFLAGFAVADAPLFETWLTIERERLRNLMLDMLLRLADRALVQQDYQQGIGYATRLLALDPLREDAHRQLMRLYARSGQRAAALAQYERLRRLLDDELGIDPDAETEALQHAILDGATSVAPPATLPGTRLRYAVPTPPGALIGREHELAALQAMLVSPTYRLVTITGLGGAGKTRLALEAARQLVITNRHGERFPHGVVFAPLAAVDAVTPLAAPAPAVDAALAASIADALQFSFSGSDALHVQLADYLREKRLLLVLDNCEHVPVAQLVAHLLQHAPNLMILATSRARLHVRGEHVLALDGLAFPLAPAPATLAALDRYDAIQLFHATARASNTRLIWSQTEASAAATICALVDGLPLGIELAASLARVLPCGEIAHEIMRTFEVLQHGPQDLPARHQSLRAVFLNSWTLLGPPERAALGQLALFRAGFDRAAAEQVAGATLPLLLALLDQSLIRTISGQESTRQRYDMPELVRQYAIEQLDAATRASTADRHCHYFLTMLQRWQADLRGPHQETALIELQQEIDNIRAAWAHASATGQVALIAQAAEGLFLFYEMRSRFQEGADAMARAAATVEREQTQPHAARTHAALVGYHGWLTFQLGQHAAGHALLAASVAHLRTPEATDLVLPLCYLAAATYYMGKYTDAERLALEARAVSATYNQRHGVAIAETILGQIAYLVGNYDAARSHSEASLRIEQALGNRWGSVFALLSLGRVAQARGAYAEAQHFFQAGLTIRQQLRDTRGVALCLLSLGDTAAAQDEHNQAGRYYQESGALFREIGSRAGEADAQLKLGYSILAAGDVIGASQHLDVALAIAWEIAALPRVLDALAGIALALVDSDPVQAHILAVLVASHAAATRATRDRAAAVQTQLGPPHAPVTTPTIDEAVAHVLERHRMRP